MRELKTKLSGYLREVKRGETILVTDHGQVVAQLVPPGSLAEVKLSADDRVRHRLLAEGLVSHLGTQEQGEWPAAPGGRGVKREDVEAALDAEREDRV